MTIALDRVVPWGRSLDEYSRMFALTETDLQKHILGCGDGPASFNAEATQKGMRVTSIDPIYDFTAQDIMQRVEETHAFMVGEVEKNKDTFVWNVIESPQHMGEIRLKAMRGFIADFEQGKAEGRYRTASLPELPFADNEFDLALCSHFLFLYSHQFSLQFHVEGIKELCRVASEVRIFPLLDLDGQTSPHLQASIAQLTEQGYTAELVRVPYEFQKNGHTMLQVSKRKM